ncbi:hypothetical protein FF125_01010 [Aureibaculum algae]|uniref:Uncharacterized protein n=1 Tax=Aureibaculum algae TaxID=2584122 RepID=A0A5B7TPD2_9FLAO|nr:hypothetical protein [Aureibaculum algae]QCX37084.1 hypothetical protein FF125_01010 [Aureibaculum algae]
MKRKILVTMLIYFIAFVNVNAQHSCLAESTYISMPDADTYTNRQILEFSGNKIYSKDYRMKIDTTHSFQIKSDNLIFNDKFNWGKIVCYDEYFELIDKNNSSFQYTKLKPTIIECTEEELNNIILSSHWKLNLENENGTIHINSNEEGDKLRLKSKLVKLNDTYVIFLDEWWNFTISKISKDTIELYGLAKSNNLPENLNLTRKHL